MIYVIVALFSIKAATISSFQPPAVATAILNAQSLPLDPVGDNQPQLQTFFDSLPDGVTVTLPAGTWKLNTLLRISHSVIVQSADPANPTVLKGVGTDGNRHVIDVGNYDTNVKVNGVKFISVVIQSAMTGTGIHNCLVVHGDNFVATNCTWSGSEHEGIVVHGDCLTAAVTNCTAISCGKGNASYTQSTSGFNSHAHPTIYTNCVAIDCGQGFEIDGHGTVLDNCLVTSPPSPVVGPQIAYNIGSTGLGIYDVTVKNSRSVGYSTAVQTGNGIGRLAKVNITSNLFVGGTITFTGGKPDNTVTDPNIPAGPDTSGSTITNNNFTLTGQNNGVIGYIGGINAGDDVMAREPLQVTGNYIAYTMPTGTAVQDSPVLYTAGKVPATVLFANNTITGLDTPPSRGDYQDYSVLQNVRTPGSNTGITLQGNRSFKSSATSLPVERPFWARVEGIN